MNSVNEKEKKLYSALTKLKNINLKNPDIKKNLENLTNQKNQLKIEKQELEAKCNSLEDDYKSLTKKPGQEKYLMNLKREKKMVS